MRHVRAMLISVLSACAERPQQHERSRVRGQEQRSLGGTRLTSSNTPPTLSSTPGAGRPSLGAARGADVDKLSILASLESRERTLFAPAASRVPWGWIAGAVLVFGGVAAYVLQPTSVAAIVQFANAGTFNSSPPVTNSSADARASVPMQAASAVEATRVAALVAEPARIENIEPARVAASSASAPMDPFAALSAAAPAASASKASNITQASSAASAPVVITTPATAATGTAAVAAPASKPVASAKQKQRTAAKASKPNTDKARADKANPRQPVVASNAKPATREARKDKDTAKDPDVDLLAALMAHAANPGGTAAARDAGKPIDEPSIAKLVKRCDLMSGEEARQCQRRICDGYWGKAQACPAKPSTPHE